MVGETVQVNFRWPKELVRDLEFVAKNLKVQKGDWVRMKLSKALSEERHNLENHIIRRFTRGYISEEEYFEKMGKSPSKQLLNMRQANIAADAANVTDNRKASKKFLLESVGLDPDAVSDFEEPSINFVCPHCFKESELPLTGEFFKGLTDKKEIICPKCKQRFEFKKT